MIRILHLTDFHYKSKTYDRFSQDQIIEKLCAKLTLLKGKIDIIVFTGDLVYSGKEYNGFEEANYILISKVLEASGLNRENIIFCAGNHDVDRGKRLDSLEFLFEEKIVSSDNLYDFVAKESSDFLNSIDGIKNYNTFINHCCPVKKKPFSWLLK